MLDKKENEAKVLFDHDRTCCVCRDPNKKFIQIHHIDGNHQNDDPDNLAVLCKDCHTETQIEGGFFKKLSPPLVRLYRDEWLEIVKNTKRSKPQEEESFTPLTFSAIKDPIQLFLQQFTENKILPLGITFRFRDYYFLVPGFPTLVIDSDAMTPENGSLRKSVLKAYLLCVLGLIAPPGMLVSNTFTPGQSVNRVQVGRGVKIAVPRWYITGFEELSHLHLTGDYDRFSNQILLTLAPIMYDKNRNYDLLGIKLERIAQELKGKAWEL